MKKNFNFRGFISLYIAISFIVITLSGIVLYISPAGRIANWSNWKYFGLLKSQWQSIHTIFTFVFVLAVLFHLFYNWKPLLAYIKTKIASQIRLRKEIVVALVLSVLILVLTVNNVAPFSSVIDFGQGLRNSDPNTLIEPPIPHAEEQSIKAFAETVKMPVDELTARLVDKGIKIESDAVKISELAKQNNLTPSGIYNLIGKTSAKAGKQTGEGKGYGRKTVEQLCKELNLSVDKCIKLLSSSGIKAGGSEKIKDIAYRYKLKPVDLVNTISQSNKNL